MILGLPWLQEHNPEVNWATGEVKMSQCPEKCKQCRMEEKEEKKEKEQVEKKIQQCRVGPFPELNEEEDDEEDEEEKSQSPEIEKGDWVFMTIVHPEGHQIQATRNIFQRLAEGYHQNAQVKSFQDAVPNYLHEFKDVFSEEAYDKLPEWKQWDHAVELIPGAVAKGCKVYQTFWDTTEFTLECEKH